VQSNLLQRKCGCGQSASLTGQCSECQRKKLAPERGLTDSANESEAPPVVHEVLRSSSKKIQPKLKVSQSNDKYEQEADRIADQIMRMPEPSVMANGSAVGGENLSIQRLEKSEDERDQPEELQLKPLVGAESIQRQELEEDEEKDDEEEMLQTKRSSSQVPEVIPSIETGIQSLRRSGGQPLPPSIRTFMESRFNQDFSDVRLHTTVQASQLAQSLDARAFTIVKDIVFGTGEFNPSADYSRHLLAHELTHVVQQTGAKEAKRQLNQGREQIVFRQPKQMVGNIVPSSQTSLSNPSSSSIPATQQDCLDGAFMNDTQALKTFFQARQLAKQWTDTALTVFNKVRNGTGSPDEEGLVNTSFKARFGDLDTFAGMKDISKGGVPKPRVAQNASDVVFEVITRIAQVLSSGLTPVIERSVLPSSPIQSLGFELDFMANQRKGLSQREAIVASGAPVFCGQTPTGNACAMNVGGFFDPNENAIALCDLFFFSNSDQQRIGAAILIHELVHAVVQPGRMDIYTHDRLFRVLQAAPDTLGRVGGLALNNPDSITEFIRVVAEVTTEGSAGLSPRSIAPDDRFEGFGNRETEVALALGFASERITRTQEVMANLFDSGTGTTRSITVSTSGREWGSSEARQHGCRIQRIFENTDSRAKGLGKPCEGTERINSDGVDLINEIQRICAETFLAFFDPLTLRYQPKAVPGFPVVWISGNINVILIDESFFSLDPPAQARAIILGMQKRSIQIPTGSLGTPSMTASISVVDGISSTHVELMDAIFNETFKFFAGPGG